MGKNIAAGVAGVVIAVTLVWIIEMIGHAVYPPPLDLDFTDAEAMKAYIATLPLGVLIGAWLGTMCKRATAGNDA